MAKQAFIDHNFATATLAIINQANAIIEEYQAQGFTLTVRQLYYQFVARDVIPNSQRSYKRIVGIMGNARMAGLIDWNAIEDRTRRLISNSHWRNEKAMMNSAARWFEIDKWRDQPNRLEVWIEKEALAGVIQPICQELDIAFFACKGYPSLSGVYEAAKRMARYNDSGQNIHILHLGDHDPSGVDMTRDIQDRITQMAERMVSVDRLALNWDQIETFQPPPYFAKTTDSRSTGYIAKFGPNSWELDALNPDTLATVIETAALELRDEELWDEAIAVEKHMIANLGQVRDRWGEVTKHLELD